MRLTAQHVITRGSAAGRRLGGALGALLLALATPAAAVTRCVYFDDLTDGQRVASGSTLMNVRFAGDAGKNLVAERLPYGPYPVTGLLTDPAATASWAFPGAYRVTLDYITHSPTPGGFAIRRADGTLIQRGKLRAVNHFAHLTDTWLANGATSIELTGRHVLITSICVAS